MKTTKTKHKRFNDYLFEYLNDSKHYDKLCYEFNRIRKIMIKDNPEFDLLSIEKQFHQCFSIWRISCVSKRSIMNEISIFRDSKNPDDDIKNYDPEYGYELPTYVEINSRKILLE